MPGSRFTPADQRRIALAERRRIRRTVSDLTAEQWSTPSLCEGWTVRDVVGHVASNSDIGMGGFLVSMAGARFDHDEHNRRSARSWAQRPTAELLAPLDGDRIMLAFRVVPALLLVDNVVHHQDIRRPLGLGTDFPEEHLAAALDAVFSARAFAGDAARAEGRRLVATDIEWSHGTGPEEVRDTAEHLILSVMGRPVGPNELSAS